MTGRTVPAWLSRLLLVVGAAGAVIVMHSLPMGAHDGSATSPVALTEHTAAMAADPMGHEPTHPVPQHDRSQHLCLSVLTVLAISVILALLRHLSRTRMRLTAEASPPWRRHRSPPPRKPPSLAQLCVLRL